MIRRNKAKLTILGLLTSMMSAASPSADRSNIKKRLAPQDDVERRVQPTSNAKKMTSYRDLDDPVINKRTRSINSSDIGEEDTDSKTMDKAEYSPSGGDDEEEDDNDDDDDLDRQFPQAKAEAAVEALTDIYGHSKTVSYCDTNDSDLQSDEDGNEASKKRSFKMIANTEPDLLPARRTVLPPPPHAFA